MSEQDQQQPVVIKQGGNGIGLVVAALIIPGQRPTATPVATTPATGAAD